MINHCKTDDVRNLLDKYNKIIITAHINPDGDALGSAMALYYYLKSMNKEVSVINYSPSPKNLAHLDVYNDIIEYDIERDYHKIQETELIIVVDLNETRRLKTVGDAIKDSSAVKLVIDHHLEPKEFADFYCMGYDDCATGFIVWKILHNWKIDYDTNTANAIYTAIMTDTGNFRFDRTTSEVHRATADLLDHGAKPDELYDKVYNQHSLQGKQLLGLALAGMQLHYDGLLCMMMVHNRYFKETGAEEDEVEGFVGNTLSLSGVKVGILMTEVKDRDEIRISFRSKDGYFIRELAAKFNGGGHAYASGARVKSMSMEDLKEKILLEAKELF